VDKRVQFDFEIEFTNGGGLRGQEFRFDIDGKGITGQDLANYIVEVLMRELWKSIQPFQTTG
jgi:hypothetical protein